MDGEIPVGEPLVEVTVTGDVVSQRDELDWHVHYDKDGDDVLPLKEDGIVVGYVYLLRNWEHLSVAKFAARVLSKSTYENVSIEVSLEYEEKPKKANSTKKRGRARSRMV